MEQTEGVGTHIPVAVAAVAEEEEEQMTLRTSTSSADTVVDEPVAGKARNCYLTTTTP